MQIQSNGISSFLKRYQTILISVALSLFSLHLALTDRKEVERGYVVKEIIAYTIVPLQGIARASKNNVTEVFDDYVSLVGVKKENKKLRQAVTELMAENNNLREENILGERLKNILNYKDNTPYKTIAANILGYNLDSWTRTLTINRGRTDGIVKDLAVISTSGIVGRIIEVNKNSSKVLLNSDIRSNIDVMVQRTRVKGVAEGNGTNGLSLKYIKQGDDVRPGDLLITSGISGVFPRGLAVGEVTRIDLGRDNFFKNIEVMPKVDIQRIEDVLVVTDTAFYSKD